MSVTVTPEEFTFVLFEAGRISTTAGSIATAIGLEQDIHIEVDETSPLTRIRVVSVDPVELFAQSGALEEPRHPRHLSDQSMAESLGRLLFRVKDRHGPGFGDAPQDDQLTLGQLNAWDTYSLGRLARIGFPVGQPRWIYHFRMRHGFTDVATAAFERLWSADGLTWADLDAVCAEAEQAKAAVSA
ncbi:MAG: hypothetical protein ACRDYB_02835 [Acidimicrobiales bacterium]